MNKISALLGSFALLASLNANAAPIAIDTMFVDQASAVLSVGSLGPYTGTTPISPPAEITMGAYQSSILNIIANDFTLNIYSTGTPGGNPAPSGYVDGTMINVDFSSLRGDLAYAGNNYDFALWPLTTTLDTGTFNPGNGAFVVGWTDNITIDLGGLFSTTAILDVSLEGNLTTVVPVPAAVWLFGSGLIALGGFARRKKYIL
jgi:hypothetical protein